MEGQINGLTAPEIEKIDGDHRGATSTPEEFSQESWHQCFAAFLRSWSCKKSYPVFLTIQVPHPRRFRERKTRPRAQTNMSEISGYNGVRAVHNGPVSHRAQSRPRQSSPMGRNSSRPGHSLFPLQPSSWYWKPSRGKDRSSPKVGRNVPGSVDDLDHLDPVASRQVENDTLDRRSGVAPQP